ncbi:MAG TPA: squalene synthase HpnC [Vicinamibacterales bacterium]|nr:squalene synthase HpnC [Vicinamibacterales bacterium]
MTGVSDGLARDYQICLALAASHYENFPVASWLVPDDLRPHVAAVYAFARTADDFADEDGYTTRERLRLLDDWLARLHAAVGAGQGADVPPDGRALDADAAPPPGHRQGDHAVEATRDAIFRALGHTIRTRHLPVRLFEALLSAFRQDVSVTRYATWAEVDDYCRRSANPVGRLVLRLFGYDDDRLDRWSDAICTALQLTNFWQDFALDWRRGRLYVPEAEWAAAGARPGDLTPVMASMPREWQRALAACGARTRDLFNEGRPLLDHVTGRLRWELRATWFGGARVLERLEQSRFDPVAERPKLGVTDALVIGWRTLL